METDQKEAKLSGDITGRDTVRRKGMGRTFLLLMLGMLLVAFVWMIRYFCMPVMVAAVFAGMFHPFFRRLRGALWGNGAVAAAVMCLLLLLLLLLPAAFLVSILARQAVDLYQGANDLVARLMTEGDTGLFGHIKSMIPTDLRDSAALDWERALTDIAKTSGAFIAGILQKTTAGTFQFVVQLFIVLFTMFYFFRDGERLLAGIKRTVPLSEAKVERLFQRFASVSRATLKGSLLIGLLQGTMGMCLLLIFGVPLALLWGMIMVLLSIVPMLGAWVVLFPAAGYLLLTGDVWQGLVVVVVTALVIGTIDNILRPRLVGRDSQMHDLMIFFSTLGGIAAFGVMGFVLGPVLAAFLLTVADIFSVEFAAQIEEAQKE